MDLRDAGEIIEQVGACNVLPVDRKSTRLNSSHSQISYAVFCLKKKSIDMSSRMPCSYGCPGSISHRVSSSTSGRELGRSPYTLLVEQWITGASMQCSRTFCRTLRVPVALTSKSVKGSRTAQSWEGCAAVWITRARSRP